MARSDAMTNVAERGFPADDLLIERPESTAPDYLAWKHDKIAAAIRHADDNPDDFVSEEEVWKTFGLDY
jgi:hypothetical protein